MEEKLIKEITKFLNTPFKHMELVKFLEKQKDFLLQPGILEKIEDNIYNALWDTICDLENLFKYAADNSAMTIGFSGSVLLMYDNNLKLRKSLSPHLPMNKTEETKTAEEILNSKKDSRFNIPHMFVEGSILEAMEEYASQFKQSQSPDKEQPKELEELLEKYFPIITREAFYRHGLNSNESYREHCDQILLQREFATKFFLSGKGAQGREIKWLSVKENETLLEYEEDIQVVLKEKEVYLLGYFSYTRKIFFWPAKNKYFSPTHYFVIPQ